MGVLRLLLVMYLGVEWKQSRKLGHTPCNQFAGSSSVDSDGDVVNIPRNTKSMNMFFLEVITFPPKQSMDLNWQPALTLQL